MMNLIALAVGDESFTNAMRRARSALNLLADLRIPPSPARFTVAYAHQSGDISDLSLAMNRLIGHDRLTGQAVDELYIQFFGGEVDRAELTFAAQKVQDTVSDATEQVAASRLKTDSYAESLRDFAQELETGAQDLGAKLAALLGETEEMARDHHQLEDRLTFALRELETLGRHLDRLEREARKDPLTGIGNRAHFNRALRSAIAKARRDEQPLCLLMIDIDHFKQFNDHYGHQMGDQVLKLVARQLVSVASDAHEPARYGGEEFALILRRCGSEQAVEMAHWLRKLVAGKKVVNRLTQETLGQVTLSIGAALYRPGETAAELVHRADEAMYLAKAEGRNCVVSDDHPGMSA
jgi:diguanylate cyclase